MFEEEEGDPVNLAVHPSGDDIVCSTVSGGCKSVLSLSLITNLNSVLTS